MAIPDPGRTRALRRDLGYSDADITEQFRRETEADEPDDASLYDLLIGMQQTRSWLAAIAITLILILWRVW